jgi:sec-independent protein translocase protein TatC
MDKINEKYVKYYPYLEDIRIKAYRGVVLFTVVFFVGFFQTSNILKFMINHFHIRDVVIATTSPFQFTDLATNIGFFMAIIVCIPYTIYSMYSFVAPALTKRERRFLYMSVPLCLCLFLIGFSYGFFILFFTLQMLADINSAAGIKNIWNISDFMIQIFMTASLLGLFFEFPIIMTFLMKMKLLTVKFLKNKRRLAYVSIFCLTSLLPPTDGISLIVISLPLIMLYELTILFNNNKNNNKKYVRTW